MTWHARVSLTPSPHSMCRNHPIIMIHSHHPVCGDTFYYVYFPNSLIRLDQKRHSPSIHPGPRHLEVPGQILTGKPAPGSGEQLQTSRYRGVDLSRSSQQPIATGGAEYHHCEHPQLHCSTHCPEAYTSITWVPSRGETHRDLASALCPHCLIIILLLLIRY